MLISVRRLLYAGNAVGWQLTSAWYEEDCERVGSGFRGFFRQLAEFIYSTFVSEGIFHSPLVLCMNFSLPFVATSFVFFFFFL